MQICCFHLKYFHLSFLQQRKEEGKGADGGKCLHNESNGTKNGENFQKQNLNKIKINLNNSAYKRCHNEH